MVLLLAASLFGYQPQEEPAATTDPAAAGIALYLKGDFAGASKALREAVKKNKSDAKAWHYLGLTFMSQGEAKKAAAAFDTAENLRTKAFDQEFDSSEDVIRGDQLVRLANLLRALVEVREKIVEVNGPRKPTTFEQLSLEAARAQTTCIELNTRVVNGQMTVKKTDLKITKLHVTKQDYPRFPPSERKLDVNAKVAFRGIVDPDGAIHYLELLQSSNAAFAEAGKRAAYSSRFRPATICGHPISYPVQLEYSFFSSP